MQTTATVNDRIAEGMGGAMQAANRWDGTDFHQTGHTLRFTADDETLNIYVLNRSGVLLREARVHADLSDDSLVAVGLALWNG